MGILSIGQLIMLCMYEKLRTGLYGTILEVDAITQIWLFHQVLNFREEEEEE